MLSTFAVWLLAYPAGLVLPYAIEYVARWQVSGSWPPATLVIGGGQALPPIVVVAVAAATNMYVRPQTRAASTGPAALALALAAVIAAVLFGVTVAASSTLEPAALSALQRRTVWESVGLGVAVLLASAYGNWVATDLREVGSCGVR